MIYFILALYDVKYFVPTVQYTAVINEGLPPHIVPTVFIKATSLKPLLTQLSLSYFLYIMLQTSQTYLYINIKDGKTAVF